MKQKHGLRVRQWGAALAVMAVSTAQASQFKVLHQFGSQNPDGSSPTSAAVQGLDGAFYGVTNFSDGGAGLGIAYRQSLDGTFTVIHSFCSPDYDCPLGDIPQGGLMLMPDGSFLGGIPDYTSSSDSSLLSALYSMTPDGTASLVHAFQTTTESWNPMVPLMLASDGNYYGVNAGDIILGGPNESGSIYRMTPAGTVTVLYLFPAVNGQYQNSDGAYPISTLIEGPDGALYGTCDYGGAGADGTVFKITKSGVFTLLHTFTGGDGALPQGPLVFGDDGNLYGTTSGGGKTNFGTLYRISPAGVFTLLHQFNAGAKNRISKDPTNPIGLIKAPGGYFYGAGYRGGKNGTGAVFKVDTQGTVTTLHSFAANSTGNADGAYPYVPPVLGSDGSLYGTTSAGGTYDQGTLYRLTP